MSAEIRENWRHRRDNKKRDSRPSVRKERCVYISLNRRRQWIVEKAGCNVSTNMHVWIYIYIHIHKFAVTHWKRCGWTHYFSIKGRQWQTSRSFNKFSRNIGYLDFPLLVQIFRNFDRFTTKYVHLCSSSSITQTSIVINIQGIFMEVFINSAFTSSRMINDICSTNISKASYIRKTERF